MNTIIVSVSILIIAVIGSIILKYQDRHATE
jgi:hypothetical protein